MTRDLYFKCLKEKLIAVGLTGWISRKDLTMWTALIAGNSYISYMDQFVSNFKKAGYFSNSTFGEYQCTKLIPADLKSSRLFEQAYPENEKVIAAIRRRRLTFVKGCSTLPEGERERLVQLISSDTQSDVKLGFAILQTRFDYTD